MMRKRFFFFFFLHHSVVEHKAPVLQVTPCTTTMHREGALALHGAAKPETRLETAAPRQKAAKKSTVAFLFTPPGHSYSIDDEEKRGIFFFFFLSL